MTRAPFQLLALGLALVLAGCSGFESINKKPKFLVSFHAQGGEMDSPRSIFRWTPPGLDHEVVFKRVPEVTQENVAAFHSFPASNGNGFGVTFRLDFRGTSSLDLTTRTRVGEMLLEVVNGRPVGYLTIDRPVSDGLITIWEGISGDVVKLMAEKWPPIKELHSVSAGQEMLPTTRAEKRRSREDAERRMNSQDSSARGSATKTGGPADVQSPSLPSAPTTNQIPLEGNRQEQALPPIQR